MVAGGFGTWHKRVSGPGTHGGRPADEFVLSGVDADGTTSPPVREPEGVPSESQTGTADAAIDETHGESRSGGGEVPSASTYDEEEREAIRDEGNP